MFCLKPYFKPDLYSHILRKHPMRCLCLRLRTALPPRAITL
jgi:hypothetical protein